jgi:hypothetical protein
LVSARTPFGVLAFARLEKPRKSLFTAYVTSPFGLPASFGLLAAGS